MFLEKAVAALRIRLSDLRRVPGKKIRRGIGFDKGKEINRLMKNEPVRQYDNAFSWRRKRK